jgi:hypothetical protein
MPHLVWVLLLLGPGDSIIIEQLLPLLRHAGVCLSVYGTPKRGAQVLTLTGVVIKADMCQVNRVVRSRDDWGLLFSQQV